VAVLLAVWVESVCVHRGTRQPDLHFRNGPGWQHYKAGELSRLRARERRRGAHLPAPQMVSMPRTKSTGSSGMLKGRQRSWLGVTTPWWKSAVSVSAAGGAQQTPTALQIICEQCCSTALRDSQ
jgi:hypothetical protein